MTVTVTRVNIILLRPPLLIGVLASQEWSQLVILLASKLAWPQNPILCPLPFNLYSLGHILQNNINYHTCADDTPI